MGASLAVLCLEEGAGFVLFNQRRDRELQSSFLCLNRYKNDYSFPSLKTKGWGTTDPPCSSRTLHRQHGDAAGQHHRRAVGSGVMTIPSSAGTSGEADVSHRKW